MKFEFQALCLVDSWLVRRDAAGSAKGLKTGSIYCIRSRALL
jgi:hypothetical protein